jgi:sarcosine oxidase
MPGGRVAIVGAGIVGAATAWTLARRGVDVTVYEQFTPGHTRGSSHGRSRIWRLAYPDPNWVRLAQEGLAGWRELERDAGEPLLVSAGLLELSADGAQSSRDALDAAGIRCEVLPPAELARRFGLTVPDGWACLFQPEAGYVLADRALEAFLGGARRRGVCFEYDHRITKVADIDADAVVITAGAWAPKLLAPEGIGLPVVPTREAVAYFRIPRPVPSVLEIPRSDRAFHMYALLDPAHGLKVGCHRSGPVSDPDETAEPDLQIIASIVEWTRDRFPDADPNPVGTDTCLYTSTDDERFLLERHGRLVVGSACSGHGFKFAPAVGERLADLALQALG